MAFERQMRSLVSSDSLRHVHDLLAGEPHVAGTEGDLREIDRLAELFASMGLEVERHEFWAYLPRQGEAELEIIAPEHVALPLAERTLPEDPFTSNPDLTIAWNAYSGSGQAEGQVVYANYGRKEDFERLRDLGVDLRGRIVIARYGGNYRGYKAKFAERAGAAGLIIYSDPADAGYARGLLYPEGGWANDSYIQRGSIKAEAYPGDPLTPFVEATRDAKRLDPDAVDLPRIPVQPIGYGAAQKIMERMTGPLVPGGWQGGLPFPYRVTGGDDLRVRLRVEQERKLVRTANVLGTLRGRSHPEQRVIIGSHHDAWSFGAADPLAGTICTIEAARVLSEMVHQGWVPERSIVFATWGAEEFGLIGSVEWVEANRQSLLHSGVAYMNMDMSALGPNFGSSSGPGLRRVIAQSASAVRQARDPSRTVLQAWLSRGEDPMLPGWPRFGDLGGGSDHIGFNCHVGVSSAGFGASGSQGTSYHSNYDTLTWYRKVVGDDYEPAIMLARVAATTASRLADAPILPLDPARYGLETRRHLRSLTTLGRTRGLLGAGSEPVAPELAGLDGAARAFGARAGRLYDAAVDRSSHGTLTDDEAEQINALVLAVDRAWLDDAGVPDRPWFRSLFAATDENSGYASWMLPALRYAIEHDSTEALNRAITRYEHVFGRLNSILDQAERALNQTD